jgi:signal transduction histidine kinase
MIKAQKLDSIGTLAGGLAHDYNNLLSVIMGNVDLAKLLITKNDQAYAVLTKAEQAILKARDLTQQLSTFSRGGYPLSKIIDIRECLTQSVRLALSGSNIRPEWNIAEDLPEVKVDENQIRLVIQNIVINAREAMPLGGTLFIDANKVVLKPDNTMLLPESTYIRLAFRDEGMGIPAENLHKVFDPYFTTKDMGSTKGMGLGLSICYSIIKRHLGHIMLESEEGAGTTVIIHLPAARVHLEL